MKKESIILVGGIPGHKYILQGYTEDNKLFYRTTGLSDLCGLDLEINLSVAPLEARRVIDYICHSVEDGAVIKDGIITTALTGAIVLIEKRKAKYPVSNNEECYRIILSDEAFLLPIDEDCNEAYKHQME